MASNSQAKHKPGYFPKQIDTGQAKDSGLAIVLILLLVAYFRQEWLYVGLGIFFLIVAMAIPQLFRPFAKLWLGLSVLLGTVMSKVVMSIVFFGILTPIGMVRRLFGADPLLAKQWKKDRTSVFKVRNHRYKPEEIERPY